MKKKKVLIFGPVVYPLDAGGKVIIYATLEKLQDLPIDVTYCGIVESSWELEKFNELKQKLPAINFIHTKSTIRKVPNKSTRNTIKEVVRKGYQLLSRKKGLEEVKYDEFYLTNRTSPFSYKSETYIKEIYAITREKDYDIIQTEFHQHLDLISLFPNNVKTVHFVHESRMIRLQSFYEISNASNVYKNFLLMRNKSVETFFMKQYNKLILLSQEDKHALTKIGIENGVNHSLPVMDKLLLPNKVYKKPKKMIFLGAEGHVPNSDGIKWFLENCHTSIIEKCSMPLYVIGNWSSGAELSASYSNVHFLGYCEDLDTVFEESVMIVPVRFGGGIRTKILESLGKKTPVITTTKALIGIEAKNRQELLIADSKEEFENAVQWILSNSELSKQMVDTGFEFIKENYDQTKYAKQRFAFYESL